MKEGFPQLQTELEQPKTLEKKEILEQAHEERLVIISSSFNRVIRAASEKIPQPVKSAGSVMFNLTPFVAEIKLTAEAWKGETLSGRELSNTDRVLQLVVAATAALGKICAACAVYGRSLPMAAAGAVSYGTSWATFLYLTAAEVFENIKNAADKYDLPQVKTFVTKVESFKQKMKATKALEEKYNES